MARATAVIQFAVGGSSLGQILVAATEVGVCSILMGASQNLLVCELQRRFPQAVLMRGDAELAGLLSKVVDFVESPRSKLDVPLHLRGTAFQRSVWQALREIPAGETASYSDIATWIGAPKSVRAVAQACASNPAALAIPCHRVVRTDGSLASYRWGVERKRSLLQREMGA
jgi:AraC family transcriptional regulator of adaptative response/methylated-DNA-[protein]-cysteine methyltransferase